MLLSNETNGNVNSDTKRKTHSLDHVMKTLNPSVLCIQETKLRKAGKIKDENLKNFVIFDLTRKQSHGGGLANLVKPELHSSTNAILLARLQLRLQWG